jgi:amino acid adenylation domain-containing protein
MKCAFRIEGASAPAEPRIPPAEWNETGASYPKEKTIHGLFEHQVTQTPDAVAVVFGLDCLTYRELNRRANTVAAELRHKGCRVETPVGVFVERSLDLLVSVLGILKAGGAYLPLDPFFPRERLAFMIEDAGIRLIVTQQPLVSDLPRNNAESICVDHLDYASSSPARNSPASSANLAYILYTSGSTGRPKGVQISHRSVVNLLYAMRTAPGLSAKDVMPAITTLAFDIAVLELFLPLIVGGKVVMVPCEVTVDGGRLAQLISDSGATVMQATPATWRMLIDAGWRGNQGLKILCGGEDFDQDFARSLLERSAALWNMYGPTEATVYSVIQRLLPDEPVSIGRPIANTRAYILDADLGMVPVGTVGELHIAGDGVARGYLGRPELTSERFLPDPFDDKLESRMYKTGDLARYRSDGKIEFVGRADHQVKIRGFRIELGEIESALIRTAGVAQAVVVVRDDESNEKSLVAYVVLDDSQLNDRPDITPSPAPANPGLCRQNAASLRRALRQVLPAYMIPSAFVFLDALPLTATRKVDRKALPEPVGAEEDANERYSPPIGSVEEKLAAIFATVLKVPRAGRNDSFFDLGGHSLLAARLFAKIEETFGKRLPLATLFHAPTVEDLAAAIERQPEHVDHWASLIRIRTGLSKARFFCVHGAGGNVLLYRDLALHLGDAFSLYGLQSQGLDGNHAPLRTVEEMAGRYLDEIRKVQPQGPYYVGGYCLGGTIAYEIAQRLRRHGHEVALVALMDTYNFSRMKRPVLSRFLCQKIAFHWANMREIPLWSWPRYFSHKLRVARGGEMLSLLRMVTRSSTDRPRASQESVQDINEKAAEFYEPKPYTGHVMVFKPKVNYDFYPDRQMGWGDLVTGRLDVVELPVHPHAMLAEPYVQILANHLKKAVGSSDRLSGGTRRNELAAITLVTHLLPALNLEA